MLQMRSQWFQRFAIALDATNSIVVAKEQFSSM